ncbi:MAG: ABC transporter substrate-binding protein [Tissierellia bacterium]|jgi:branched-chain amino acid transport system substrate-binding protein|nr:ABC transporter substrate-binding protein [Tissierellia bacterium]
MKKLLSLILTVVLVFSLVACTSDSSTDGDQPASGDNVIKIGVFEPVTGENGGGGFQEVLGIRYAHQLTNTVEIGGEEYTIELVEVDNKSDRTEAVTVASNLVAQNVSAIIGSYGSGVSIAAGPTYEEAQIPAVAPSATNPQVTLGNEYYFRVCFLDPFQGEVMANYAFQDGLTKAAVITQLGDDYSSGLGNFFLKAFEELGGEIVSEQQFQTGDTDFKAILANVKNAEPDVIFAPSSVATAPLLIKQARELGIEAKIMAGDTWENQAIIDNAGADAEGVALSTFFDENDTSSPLAGEFVTGFKEFLNGNDEYLNKNGGDGVAAVSALGFDAYNVVVEAIKVAQSSDSVAIKDALKGLSLDGVTGSISFDENGDAKKDMAYIKIIQDGKFMFDKTVKTQ